MATKPALLSLLRAAATDDNGLSLAAFNETQIRWAIETGLGPLLHYATKGDPNFTRSRHSSVLLSASLTAEVMSGDLLDAMGEIIDACNAHAGRLTLLKGISIFEQHYPKPYLRPMRDIDCLVEQCAFSSVESTLLKLGYQQRSGRPASFYKQHNHGIPLFDPRRGIWIEIHTGLFPTKAPVGNDKVFTRRNIASELRSSVFQGREVNRLSNELQIVYTSSHWAWTLAYSFDGIGGMIPMLDTIYLLKNADVINWARVFSWLQDSVSSTYLYIMLTYLDKYGVIAVDREILDKLSLMQRALGGPGLRCMHRLIDDYIADGKCPDRFRTPNNLRIVWATLLSSRSPTRNLLSLPWNLLFPPGSSDRFSLDFQFNRIKSMLGVNQ